MLLGMRGLYAAYPGPLARAGGCNGLAEELSLGVGVWLDHGSWLMDALHPRADPAQRASERALESGVPGRLGQRDARS